MEDIKMKAKYGTKAYHKERADFYAKMIKKMKVSNEKLKKKIVAKRRKK
jgi:hypothetical protein